LSRIFAREVAEFVRRRGLLLLIFVAPVVLLLLIGNLRVREPVMRFAIAAAAAEEDNVARLRSVLDEIAGIDVVVWTEPVSDERVRALEQRVDIVAVPGPGSAWRFHTPLTSRYRLQLATAVVQDVALALERADKVERELALVARLARPAPDAVAGPQAPQIPRAGQVDSHSAVLAQLEREIKSGAAVPTPVIAAELSRRLVSYYPPPSQVDRSIVPGFIALIAVFLPFLLASAAVVKEREAGTLETLVLAARRSWARITAGKIVLPVGVALVTILLLLVVTRTAYGYGLKPGLAPALGVQLLAALVSALFGFGISTLIRSQQEAYLTSAVYLVALILVTGMIYPIEQAAVPVVLVSYAFPLTFSAPLLEAYMTQGAAAVVEPWRLAGLAAQLGAALALCALAIRRMKGTL
jgi:ABC-type multidrug transport system permease subunit